MTAAKGIPEPFIGDHLLVSFNAVTVCGTHILAACRLALAARTAAADPNTRLGLTIGLASGVASVGTLGSKTMKRFSILGGVVNAAFLLERLCAKYDVGILVGIRRIASGAPG